MDSHNNLVIFYRRVKEIFTKFNDCIATDIPDDGSLGILDSNHEYDIYSTYVNIELKQRQTKYFN